MEKFTRTNIQGILRGSGLDSSTARKSTARIIAAIFEFLVAGASVELRGLGSLEVRERKTYKAHNPKTGEVVIVPQGRHVVFRPGQELKAALRGQLSSITQ